MLGLPSEESSDESMEDEFEERLQSMRENRRKAIENKYEEWEMKNEIYEIGAELKMIYNGFRYMTRTYNQYRREGVVERSSNEYLRTIDVTHSLMDEVGHFLFQ